MRWRMAEHNFDSSAPALITILTPGKGEDGWTPKVNGVIDSSQQMEVDGLGFLNKKPSDVVSNKQRAGRAGRVAHSLVCHLADAVESGSKWTMPYPERLKVSLAAMDLRFTKEIPGLSVADQEDAKADLVRGDIVFKICVVWDLAGPLLFS